MRGIFLYLDSLATIWFGAISSKRNSRRWIGLTDFVNAKSANLCTYANSCLESVSFSKYESIDKISSMQFLLVFIIHTILVCFVFTAVQVFLKLYILYNYKNLLFMSKYKVFASVGQSNWKCKCFMSIIVKIIYSLLIFFLFYIVIK